MTSYREYQGFRGTSRGRGNLWRGTDGRNNNATDQPQEPYGSTIDSFNSKALFVEEVAPTIQYVEYVASYSWLDGTSPVILVPGQYGFYHFSLSTCSITPEFTPLLIVNHNQSLLWLMHRNFQAHHQHGLRQLRIRSCNLTGRMSFEISTLLGTLRSP